MGFGTAHHATTRLCLALMQRINLTGASVTDLGTGSGVLAITASRLGAVRVLAIEDDADAVDSAAENLALNPGARVDLRLADMRATMSAPADLVVANLTGALLAQEASRIQALATPAGHLILSGFLTSEESAVTAAFTGWAIADRLEEDGWVSVHFRR
jgi:ribosomal protein L11 methyltransferase